MRRDRIDEPEEDDGEDHWLVTTIFLVASLTVVAWIVADVVSDHRACTEHGGVSIVVRGWPGEERCVKAASLENVR